MPTTQQYRQAAARAYNPDYVSSTATSNSSVSVLEITSYPIKSSIAQNELYQDAFILRPGATTASDRVRVVATYTPSAGHLTPELAWAVSPYAGGVGEAIELHKVIEPWTEMNYLINEVLKRILVPVEFTGTPTAEKIRHSMTTVSDWLTDPDQICQVGYLTSGEDRNETDPFSRVIRGTSVLDGAVVCIEHPNNTFQGTDTLYIRAMKPAYYHCKVSGGTLGGQSGLSLNTDEAPGPVLETWVAAGVLVEAWRRYGYLLEPTASKNLIKDQAAAAAWFSDETRKNRKDWLNTFDPPLAQGRFMQWGPRR